MITIIDYGMGNIGSLENMIRKVGGAVCVAHSAEEVLDADKLLLPGVGAFDNAMKRLGEKDLVTALNQKVIIEKRPILCICLGAQLVTYTSEEGCLPGLQWVRGRAKRFCFNHGVELRVPHMGWNDIDIKRSSRLLDGIGAENAFYFVHSYYLEMDDPNDIVATTEYGFEFPVVIEHNNIYATQFHPEKSHKYGMRIMANFKEI